MTPLTPFDLVVKALKDNDLIPSVVPESFSPSVWLDIKFPSSGKEVTLGNLFTPEDAKEEPTIHFTGDGSDDSTYTLILTDPDAPSRHDQKFGQWRHWVIPGLKPTSNVQADAVTKTQESATPYVGPGPGPNTGLHRYTFLLFKEPAGLELTLADVGGGHTKEERRHWNAIKFAETKGLTLVGANLFLIQA